MYLPPQSSNWCSYNGMYYTAIFFGGPAKKNKNKKWNKKYISSRLLKIYILRRKNVLLKVQGLKVLRSLVSGDRWSRQRKVCDLIRHMRWGERKTEKKADSLLSIIRTGGKEKELISDIQREKKHRSSVCWDLEVKNVSCIIFKNQVTALI